MSCKPQQRHSRSQHRQSRPSPLRFWWRTKGYWASGLLSLVAAGALWWGYKQVQVWLLQPEAVFVLGGEEERERHAAVLAQKYPDLPIWISSGSPKWYAEKIFTNAGISRDRLHLDYRARDTVTNFTTIVEDLQASGIDSVYLVTSEHHMRRARIVGEIVFGSRGIAIKPSVVASDYPPEPWRKSARDGTRALLWLTTGCSGEDREELRQWLDRWRAFPFDRGWAVETGRDRFSP